jgi:hypothetical protein
LRVFFGLVTPSAKLVRSFPRSFRLANRPLLALLLVLGVTPAIILWSTGNAGGLWVVGGLLVGATLLMFSIQLLVELFGARFVAALYEDGFSARRLFTRTFVPYDDVERVRVSSVITYVQGQTVREEVFDVDWGMRTPARITAKEGGAETAEFIIQRAGLSWEGDVAERA